MEKVKKCPFCGRLPVVGDPFIGISCKGSGDDSLGHVVSVCQGFRSNATLEELVHTWNCRTTLLAASSAGLRPFPFDVSKACSVLSGRSSRQVQEVQPLSERYGDDASSALVLGALGLPMQKGPLYVIRCLVTAYYTRRDNDPFDLAKIELNAVTWSGRSEREAAAIWNVRCE